MNNSKNLPYRKGVGMMVFNDDKKIFVGKRIDNQKAWQMPQGGVDENEGGVRLTTAKYYLPSGVSIHEKGVEPDITVKRNKDNFKINTKTDNQLNYAIKLLKTS